MGTDRTDAGRVRRVVAGRQRGIVPAIRWWRRRVLPFTDSAGNITRRMPRLQHLRKFPSRRRSEHQTIHRSVFCQPHDQSRLGETWRGNSPILSRRVGPDRRRRQYYSYGVCSLAARRRLVRFASEQRLRERARRRNSIYSRRRKRYATIYGQSLGNNVRR